MKSSALAALLNMPDSTLRKYSGVYAEFLSPAVNVGAGQHRDYTDHDARVLRLIMDMKANRMSAENIDVTLRALQSSGWERLPTLDDKTLALLPTPQALIATQGERSALQAQIDLLREMLDKATSDRDDLVSQLAEARTMLKLYESGRLKPPGA